MGLRFRKSIKIANGVKLNFGKKGVGVSVGGKGARYSINSSGRRTATVGIPGTGLSYSHTSGGKKKSKSRSNSDRTTTSDDGRVKIEHNLALDIVLTICTGGLWLIWVLLRPKYK